jgi:hypothetical protein
MSFKDKDGLLGFADKFLKVIIERFEKDLKICLTANEQGKHAYFPALQSCIATLELMAKLHIGDVEKRGQDHVTEYACKYMDQAIYSKDNIFLLYEVLRHKVAHLSHPYYVTKVKDMRLTWTVDEAILPRSINLLVENKKLEKFSPPWDVPYDHRLHISIPTLASDILTSIEKYKLDLKEEQNLRNHFQNCMLQFFPK